MTTRFSSHPDRSARTPVSPDAATDAPTPGPLPGPGSNPSPEPPLSGDLADAGWVQPESIDSPPFTDSSLDTPADPRARTARLHPADAAAVDVLMDRRSHGLDGSGPVPAGLGGRVAKVEGLLGLLDRDGVAASPAPADLAARTVERVESESQRAEQRRRFAQQIGMLSSGGASASPVGIRQLLGAAAILLVGVTLLMPTLQRQQFDNLRMACMSNLGQVAQAFSAYANDYNDAMPSREVAASDSWVALMRHRFGTGGTGGTGGNGGTWGTGGSPSAGADALATNVPSNSTNLHLLIDRGYVTAGQLSCPANEDATTVHRPAQTDWRSPAQVSFSYQDQSGRATPRFSDAPMMGILADRTPLLVIRVQGDQRLASLNNAVPVDAASPLHHGRGQNVLRANGSVKWTVQPLIENGSDATRDNIWLPKLGNQLGSNLDAQPTTASPTPTFASDSFLVH